MATYGFYVDLSGVTFSEGDNTTWIELMKVGTYDHAVYGKIDFSAEKLQQFADNAAANVRGVDLSIDYDHSSVKTGSSEAAGWIKQVKFEGGVLKGLVEFTKTAAEKIRSKAFRYFSPEFVDKWISPAGKEFTNVLFGGGLTNRPFLKNLLPINLSELSFGEPSTREEEVEVDPKQLRASIGLAETATDDEVNARLGLIKQLSEAFPSGPPVVPPTNTPPTPKPPTITLGAEIKALAESNPAAAALVAHLEDQAARLGEQAVQLREADTARKLHEFDGSKIALSPVAKSMASKILSDPRLPQELADSVYELMTAMRDGQSFFVELGERAGGFSRVGRDEKPAETVFSEMVDALVLKGKPYVQALDEVARANPDLYSQYRSESYAWKE
jgi:phage I-like protein